VSYAKRISITDHGRYEGRRPGRPRALFRVFRQNKKARWGFGAMCQAGVQGQLPIYSGFFRHLIGWMFALAILVLWIASAVADPITLRVVAASPVYTAEGRPSFFIKVDDDGRRTLGQFTTEHVGEDIEFRSEGRLLMKTRLRTPISGSQIQIVIVGDFGSDEVVSLASRLAMDGKIEIDALGRPQR